MANPLIATSTNLLALSLTGNATQSTIICQFAKTAMKYCIFVALLALSASCFGQERNTKGDTLLPVARYSFQDYLFTHISIKDTSSCIIGRVVFGFDVFEDGTVHNVRFLNGPGCCETELLKTVSGMPRWKPATTNGKPVKYFMKLPIYICNRE